MLQIFMPNVGKVTNESECIKILACMSNMTTNNICLGSINTLAELKSSRRYFTQSGEEIQDETLAYYMWVNTGYFNSKPQPIYASFYKNKNGDYMGAYIGDAELLEQKVFRKEPKKENKGTPTAEPATEEVKEKFEEVLYSRLFLKEGWNTDGSLQNYMYALTQRLMHLYNDKQDISDYVILNEGQNQAIINSGLLDKFGNDIHVFYSFNKETGVFQNPEIVVNKNLMVKYEFTVKELKRNIEVVPFYNNVSEIIFNADFDDFDFSNMERINHCIIERKDRLPEKYHDTPDDIMCQKLINSVQTAIRLSKRDITYVRPMYNIGRNKIQFLIPFCLENTVQSKPDLLIITDKDEYGFWNVMTVLNIEDAYYNAKLFSKYTGIWNLNSPVIDRCREEQVNG